MQVAQHHFRPGHGFEGLADSIAEADLLFVFGEREALVDARWREELRARWPSAHILGCSTSGEILGRRVFDDSIVCTAVKFEHAQVVFSCTPIGEMTSREVGQTLGASFAPEDLVHVFLVSDGLHVNGSALVEGLQATLPPHVVVTGGLSGDGDRFHETLVVCEHQQRPNVVAAVALYGDRLQVGYGSMGGWDPFGPERLVTRSDGNVLFELDNRPALELYKAYLGEHAKDLPASGLHFPLSLRPADGRSSDGVVRTILNVDEDQGSLTFAGDVPEGYLARLMKANLNRLIDGAAGAAHAVREGFGQGPPELALLISCVGRRMVLRQRVEEELDAVSDILGDGVPFAGFYSYGEISPFVRGAPCSLHNQTMTITALREN